MEPVSKIYMYIIQLLATPTHVIKMCIISVLCIYYNICNKNIYIYINALPMHRIHALMSTFSNWLCQQQMSYRTPNRPHTYILVPIFVHQKKNVEFEFDECCNLVCFILNCHKRRDVIDVQCNTIYLISGIYIYLITIILSYKC